jgi:hypothetical protein
MVLIFVISGDNSSSYCVFVCARVQVGVFLSIGGFIAGVLMVPIHPFKLAHHIIGVIVFVIGIQQPMNALCRPHPEPKTRLRLCWEYWHKYVCITLNFVLLLLVKPERPCSSHEFFSVSRIIGRVGVVLGMINCILGLFLIHASPAPIILYLICMARLFSRLLRSVLTPPPCLLSPKGSVEWWCLSSSKK